jgi:hypothetical protein
MIEFSIAVVFAVFIALASAAPNASLGLSKFAIVAGRVALIGAIIRVLRLWKGRVGYRLTETFLTAISFVASGHFVMRSPLPFFVNATVWGAIVIAGIVRF